MDGLVTGIAGTVPAPEFFGPGNTQHIIAGAAHGCFELSAQAAGR